MASISDVVDHIRANIHILFIRTSEEHRFLEDLVAELNHQPTEGQIDVIIWSASSGLKNLVTGSDIPLDNNTLSSVLVKMSNYKSRPSVAGTLFILLDMNYLLVNQIPRQLKNLVNSDDFMDSKRVMILSPEFDTQQVKYPPILERETVVLDYDLPDKRCIKSLVEDVVERGGHEDVDVESVVSQAKGLTTMELCHAISLGLAKDGTINPDRLLDVKREIVRKRGILEFVQDKITIDDVGGLDEAKRYIELYAKTFCDDAKEYGVEAPKGIILTGVPGTGKSILAKACADAWSMPCLRLDIGKIMGRLVGMSESNARDALSLAEAMAPCVLWIDEVEKAISGVKSSNRTDSGTTSRVFGTLLTWMQENTNDVIVMATANDITEVPPEFVRRFDEVFFVDLPQWTERREILKVHLHKRSRYLKNLNVDRIIADTKGYTGAEIEKVVKLGIAKAYHSGSVDLKTEHLLDAITEVYPVSKVMSEEVSHMRSWADGRARYASNKV